MMATDTYHLPRLVPTARLTVPAPDPAEIARAISVLQGDGAVTEMRALHKRSKRVDAGCFDREHRQQLVRDAGRLNADAAIYVTLNPVDPQLLARYANRTQEHAPATATDSNVIGRRWLLIDIDPQRPKDTSATDDQLELAAKRVDAVQSYLDDSGWPEPVVAESGNGFHLLYRIDLPNDAASTELVKRCLESLANTFDDSAIKIDRAVFNAARIIKLYGTVANKGDHTEVAPWRLSRLTSVPDPVRIVSAAQMLALAAEVMPAPSKPAATSSNGLKAWDAADVDAFLLRGGLQANGPDTHAGAQRWKLKACPFNPDHGPGESAVFLRSDGKLGFECRHNSCQDKHWRDLRALIDGERSTHAPNTPRAHAGAGDHTRDRAGALGAQVAEDPLGSIRASITADLAAGPSAIDAAQPPRFVCYPHMPVAGANLAATGGTGKTTLALHEMINVVNGHELYGSPIDLQGPCVLVTAEDGASYSRYVLQQVIADGLARGALPERAAVRAKADIRIIGWHRARFGPMVTIDELGGFKRAPVFDLLLELVRPLSPVYVTLDPTVLFSAGERYGNDGDAFMASMVHDAALELGACIQLIDHVSQSVARDGIVDQHAARGGTAKTDNARLARQLLRIRLDDDAANLLPIGVTEEDLSKGSILQLHWTKSNYAPRPAPVWLRRHRYWMEHLRPQAAEERAAVASEEREALLHGDVAVLVEFVRTQLQVGAGVRYTQNKLEEERPLAADGTEMTRARVRAAVNRAVATGHLVPRDLPPAERRGQLKTYLAPAEVTH